MQTWTPQGRTRQVGQRRAAALWHPVCAPPLATAPSRLHYNSFSVRVKVRPDSSAAVYGYVCFCVCVLTCCVSQRPYKADGGKDGNEQSQTERTERFMGKKYSLCFCQWDRAAPRGLGERLGLIPGAWLEVWVLVRFHYKVRLKGFWRLMGCCKSHFYAFHLILHQQKKEVINICNIIKQLVKPNLEQTRQTKCSFTKGRLHKSGDCLLPISISDKCVLSTYAQLLKVRHGRNGKLMDSLTPSKNLLLSCTPS